MNYQNELSNLNLIIFNKLSKHKLFFDLIMNEFNPETNKIIVLYIDLRFNELYHYVLPNVTYLESFIKRIFILENEYFNGKMRYNPLNYFICMNKEFKHKEGSIEFYNYMNEPQRKFKYNIDINLSINCKYQEFDNDKIETIFIKY